MSIKACLAFAVAVSGSCAFAADSAKPALPKAAARLELKNKSSFEMPAGVRNPFIPVGWKGQGGAQAVVATKKNVSDGSIFRVTSILLGTPSLAVINGRSYEEGQMIRMPKSNPQSKEAPLRAKLYRIGDGVVQIQVEETVIMVPLMRGKLNEVQPETTLNVEE